MLPYNMFGLQVTINILWNGTLWTAQSEQVNFRSRGYGSKDMMGCNCMIMTFFQMIGFHCRYHSDKGTLVNTV